jgi:hypothetical protein
MYGRLGHLADRRGRRQAGLRPILEHLRLLTDPI